jgi:hypothetical protein
VVEPVGVFGDRDLDVGSVLPAADIVNWGNMDE